MKYIKHPDHGILPVMDFTQFQRAAGWKLINIEDEVKPVKKMTEQMIVSEEITEEVIEEFLANKFSKKLDFETKARNMGCELDRRKNKVNMIKDFRSWQQSQT